MDTRRLNIFLTVADEGSFTAAAQSLLISQPAVSQAIRELERELDTALFFRIGRSITLTSAGNALVPPARQMRRDMEVAYAAVRDVHETATGDLEIACLPTLATSPLAGIVGEFRAKYPGVVVHLSAPEGSADLLEQVRTGPVELGIVDRSDSNDLASHSLGTQDYLVVFPPGSTTDSEVALTALEGFPLIVTPTGTSSRTLLEDALRVAGITAHIGVEASQREALLPLVLEGAGIAVLPRPLAILAKQLGCVVASTSPSLTRPVSLVYRNGPLTPAAERFVDIALQRNRT